MNPTLAVVVVLFHVVFSQGTSPYCPGGCPSNQRCTTVQVQCFSPPCPPLDQCMDIADVCMMPKAPGPCKAAIPRWYFDAADRNCKWFVYGGCYGNGNRFETEEQCRTFCNAEVPVEKKCGVQGDPLVVSGVQVFCGRGPSRQECPQGWNCIIDPTDRFAVCCPTENKCGVQGDPLVVSGVQVFCGRGPYHEDCPRGYDCKIDPTDRFAVCCPTEKKCGKQGYPLAVNNVEVFCGRGINQEECPRGYTCKIHPTDRYAVCCPTGASPYCPRGCPPYQRCTMVQVQCVRAPCPPLAMCVDIISSPPCPQPPAFSTCEIKPDSCQSTSDCNRSSDYCCPAGCGKRCQNIASPLPHIKDNPCKYYSSALPWPLTDTGGTERVCGKGRECPKPFVCHPNKQVCCLDVCMMPKVPGPCKAAIPRWYFDAADRYCKQFVYGGCNGNGNRFDTEVQCRTSCNAKVPVDPRNMCGYDTCHWNEICISSKCHIHPCKVWCPTDPRCFLSYSGCSTCNLKVNCWNVFPSTGSMKATGIVAIVVMSLTTVSVWLF